MNFLQKQNFLRAKILDNQPWGEIVQAYFNEVARRETVDWTQW